MTPSDPFADLLRTLSQTGAPDEEAGVRIDAQRRQRTGAPEVVYSRGKTPEQIANAARRLTAAEGRALVARIESDVANLVSADLASRGFETVYDPLSNTLVISTPGCVPRPTGGRVGILTAGSSDRPQAMEAAAVLHEMGCETMIRLDMGVAGLHRLVQPLREVLAFGSDALVVAAGMDGVLPGVVSGLVSLPVVALPTSTGYGFGGAGVGAMTTMLQACAPGVAVVNIDNGVGAGVMAGRIAIRAASQRGASSSTSERR